MSDYDCDILIVGGGPTGVTLGLIAAKHGASVIICEREADIYPLPRAAHVDHEVMRIFQSVGVAEAIAATSRTTSRYDFLSADGEILLRFDGSDKIGPGGWPAANMIHQPSVELALRNRLKDFPAAELRTGWTYLGHDEHDGSVNVRFTTADGERWLTARYLVGADGARSPVRTHAGIGLDDLGFNEPWLVIDTIVHDASRLPSINLQICDPARPTTCVLMGEGRHRWEFMLLPGETGEQVCEDGFIADLLEPWDIKEAVSLERKAVYTFNARIAKTWCKGRVLLAGDAAHQTPPFAGQGMCAGIRDAANLGWKLAWVATGQAGAAILDSYQMEREPHARATIDLAMMMGRTVCVTDPAVAAERNAAMIAARAAGQTADGPVQFPPISNGLIAQDAAAAGSYFPQWVAGEASVRQKLDDLLGSGPWLIGGNPPSEPVQAVEIINLDDPRLAPFGLRLRDWLHQHDSQSVLVRPDHAVFGAGDANLLISSWAKLLARHSPQ